MLTLSSRIVGKTQRTFEDNSMVRTTLTTSIQRFTLYEWRHLCVKKASFGIDFVWHQEYFINFRKDTMNIERSLYGSQYTNITEPRKSIQQDTLYEWRHLYVK